MHFIDEKTTVDAAYYAGRLFPKLVEDCNQLLSGGFISQQDGAPASPYGMHRKEWLQVNYPKFIRKDHWPPNSPDLKPMASNIATLGVMLEAYHKLRPPTLKSVTELKEALQVIWDSLPQEPINKAIRNFTLRLKRCAEAGGGHFEHSK